MSYVPLIAPSTTNTRIQFLSSITDSFIYVVSKVSFPNDEESSHFLLLMSHHCPDGHNRGQQGRVTSSP